MIMRFYLIVGLLVLGTTAYFIVVRQEPEFQNVPTMSSVAELQAQGILPTGPFDENEEIEHSVFDVPAMDEMMLEQAMSGMDMGGMDMGGMNMSPSADGMMTMPDGTTMPMADMAPAADGSMPMADGGTMPMADGATAPMAGMEPQADGMMTMPDGTTMPMADMAPAANGSMPMADGGTMPMEEGATAPMAGMEPQADGMMTMPDGTTMPMADMAPAADGSMTMPDGTSMPMTDIAGSAACSGESGLGFCEDSQTFDREIEVVMSEWTFSDLNIEVQAGERIRFTIRNDGTILHEFMFMAMAQMQAINYRTRRADWNLLEHEALFEKSLLLPGESMSFVVEIQSTGSWMFMCMLPYHMQMGMMGQIATPGAEMEM
tara:strand:- start:30 stop:1154 length:1125 start_codon:yes stop_codon:yes gene_type:complete